MIHTHTALALVAALGETNDLTGIIQSLNEHLYCTGSKMRDIQFLVFILVIDHSTTV